jgi:hypothetical protein
MKPDPRLRRFRVLKRRVETARSKELAARREAIQAEDKMLAMLSKREARRLDWYVRDPNKAQDRIGNALRDKRGWESRYDERNKRNLAVLPYGKLPFLWRVVSHYIDGGQTRDPTGEVRVAYMFHDSYVEKWPYL